MAQEMDLAIPIMEKAAKLAKDGQTYHYSWCLYLSEDKLEEAVSAIEEGLKKRKSERTHLKLRLTLGQAHFEFKILIKLKKSSELQLAMTIRRSKRLQIAGSNIQRTRRYG